MSHIAGHGDTERGAVFTRTEVVAAILDLCGYRSDRPLYRMRLLEPSFGAGDFLLCVVSRLWVAFINDGGSPETALEKLPNAIAGVELHEATFRRVLTAMEAQRTREIADAARLEKAWPSDHQPASPVVR